MVSHDQFNQVAQDCPHSTLPVYREVGRLSIFYHLSVPVLGDVKDAPDLDALSVNAAHGNVRHRRKENLSRSFNAPRPPHIGRGYQVSDFLVEFPHIHESQ